MSAAGPTHDGALRLLAADGDDLKVLSAALQDAVCAIGDIRFEPGPRRLTIAFNRFRWEAADAKNAERVRSALQLGGALDVKARRLRRDAPKAILSLLTVGFEPGEAPGGVIAFAFAGGGELRVTVECIDAVLADLSRPWPTRRRPSHDVSEVP
jgi:hypothetical protein